MLPDSNFNETREMLKNIKEIRKNGTGYCQQQNDDTGDNVKNLHACHTLTFDYYKFLKKLQNKMYAIESNT